MRVKVRKDAGCRMVPPDPTTEPVSHLGGRVLLFDYFSNMNYVFTYYFDNIIPGWATWDRECQGYCNLMVIVQ